MNKYTFTIFLAILLVIILIGTIVYRKDNVEELTELHDDNNIVETNTNEEVKEENVSGNNTTTKNNVQPYTYTNEFGDNKKKTTFNAKQVVTLKGFSGASSNVYYIGEDNRLYYLELTNLTTTPIATNIDHLELKDNVIAYYNEPHEVLYDSQYVVYEKNE